MVAHTSGMAGWTLLSAAAGAITLAVDGWHLSRPRWSGIPLAALVSAYLPQFFAPPAIREAHGVLLGLACRAWALSLHGEGTQEGGPAS